MFATTARLAFGYTSMVVHAVTRRGLLRRRDVRAALTRQIHITGVQALPFVASVALLFGAVVVTRALTLLGPESEQALKAVVWGGIREVGPLVTALIIIVRSSVAITAEVALMRMRADSRDPLWHEAAHEDEVVLPRVLGAAASGALLVVYFQFLAVGSALAAMSIGLGMSFVPELEHFLDAAVWWQVPLSIGKGAAFGLGIATISTYHGLHIEPKAAEVPKAVAAACTASLVFVLALDVVAVLLLLA